jgi:hypothetical protein
MSIRLDRAMTQPSAMHALAIAKFAARAIERNARW